MTKIETENSAKAITVVIITQKWLLDSGAGIHFMPRDLAGDAAFTASRPIRLNTAKGPEITTERAYVEISGINKMLKSF